MALQLTDGGKDLSDKFKTAAIVGNFSEALSHLQGLCISDALISCFELLAENQDVFNTLSNASNAKQRPNFSVDLVAGGSMPPDEYAGINEDVDLLTGRLFILHMRAERRAAVLRVWGPPDDFASNACFYPEYVRKFGPRRTRICEIAKDHSGLGSGDEMQISLFSLGGRYNYTEATAGTHPSGTTCVLFARSVLHAAGCNVVRPKMSALCNVPWGPFPELPVGYVSVAQFDGGARPVAGDIFHIQGGNYLNKKGEVTTTDSTHVGVIVKVNDDGSWSTIEGGGGNDGYRTGANKREVVSCKYGKWTFRNDIGVTGAAAVPGQSDKGVRTLRGWWDLSRVNETQWMV